MSFVSLGDLEMDINDKNIWSAKWYEWANRDNTIHKSFNIS